MSTASTVPIRKRTPPPSGSIASRTRRRWTAATRSWTRPLSRLPARHRCLSFFSPPPSRDRSARFCAVPDAARSSRARAASAGGYGSRQEVSGGTDMPTGSFDINELKRRMQGATQALKHELGGLRTGRAAASMLEPVQVEAYGTHMPLNQVATISVPEPRLLSVQVWDKSMVKAVEKAIVDSNLGLSPATEGQVLRLRIPELNEERRKELVKVAHKYAEAARIAVRHVRRDGLDTVKKLEKNHEISEDDQERLDNDVQKATDASIAEIDQLLAAKEKEILTV